MNRTTLMLLCALAPAAAAPGCSESKNHTAAPGGSVSAATGSAGTPASVIVVPVASCSATPTPVVVPEGPDPLCMPGMTEVSFQHDVAQLVGCSGEVCHKAWSYSTLVGQQSHTCCDARLLVDPGHPSTSLLVQAVSDDVASCVGRMGSLEPAAVAIIVAWVCEGAPDN